MVGKFAISRRGEGIPKELSAELAKLLNKKEAWIRNEDQLDHQTIEKFTLNTALIVTHTNQARNKPRERLIGIITVFF